MTIEQLAALVLSQTQDRLRGKYSDWQADAERVEIRRGRVYDKIDRGPAHNMSGFLMVEVRTGHIYGIRGYGQVNKNRFYGTLDTADQWYWGEYSPVELSEIPAFLLCLHRAVVRESANRILRWRAGTRVLRQEAGAEQGWCVMCVRCGTGLVAWCTSPDNHAADAERWKREALDRALRDAVADAQELHARYVAALARVRQVRDDLDALRDAIPG